MVTRASPRSGVASREGFGLKGSDAWVATKTLESRCKLYGVAFGREPTVIWQPDCAEVYNPMIKSFCQVLTKAMDGRPHLTSSSNFDLSPFGPLKDWIMILDPVDGGRDYRYRRFGPKIAEGFGTDITGSLTSDLAGPVAMFFPALFNAVLARKEPVLTVRKPPATVFVDQWWQLTVPLVDPSRGVGEAILAFQYPQKEVADAFSSLSKAVIVADEHRNVRFANGAARKLFRNAAVPYRDVPMDVFCGLTFDVPSSPLSMVERGDRITFGCDITDLYEESKPYRAELRGILQGDRAYYVLALEPK